jgi:hypothetical protein
MLAEMLGDDHEIEAVRYPDRAGDVEGRAACGEVADGAIDAAAAELDGSGLEDAMTRRGTVLVHGTQKLRKNLAKPITDPIGARKNCIFVPFAPCCTAGKDIAERPLAPI